MLFFKKNMIFLWFVLGLSSVAYGSNLEFESCEGYFSSDFGSKNYSAYNEFETFAESSKWQCRTRDNYAFALNGAAIALGGIGVLCTIAPEPAATKVTALMFGGTGAVLQTLSWLVSGLDCEDSLSETQKMQVREEACKVINRVYDTETNQCV